MLHMQGEPLNYFRYLESPEYIWIDDDKDTPRIVGTGLEDYFNGGWYFREGEFIGPLHGVPLKDPLRSMVTMYRFHTADAIRFDRLIRMAFINPYGGRASCPSSSADETPAPPLPELHPYWYSSVAYWYGQAPAPPLPPLPSHEQTLCMYRTRDRDHQAVP
jgi:hypothetical protein